MLFCSTLNNVYFPVILLKLIVIINLIFRHLTQSHVNETVNAHEVEHHSNMKEFWWKNNGPLKALHSLNPLR